MVRVIVAIERDGLDVRTLTIPLEFEDENLDIKQAVKDACEEFIETPEGNKIYGYNCGCFNWADFEAEVPNEICEKHGFKKLEGTYADMEVDWDEELV